MMDLDKNIENETPLPVYKRSETFPEGHLSTNMVKVSVTPTNNNSEFDNKHNLIQFDLPCTYNGLDPKQLFFEGDIYNPDNFAKEVDHSFHSLIKKIVVYNGLGELIEIIEDYDFLMSLHFDQTLSRTERIKRQKNEGFGINKYGTDTAILWPSVEDASAKYDQNQILDILEVQNQDLIQNQNPKGKLPVSNLKLDLFSPKDSLKLINNWDVVSGGILKPSQNTNQNKMLHFKIPLMLRTIGAWYEEGKEENEYRLIPLGIFKGGVKILIFLNTTAFSVMTNIKEFEVLGIENKLTNSGTRHLEFLNKVDKSHENPRRYILKNANINMLQYKLDNSQINQLMNALESGLYVREFNETKLLNTMYLKPYPVIQYTKNLVQKNVQRCLVVFTSDMYKHSPFARQHDRFNKGIKSVTFRLNGEVYPRPTITRHNSLYTHGDENCNFFYAELRKGLQKHAFEKDYFLTKSNFAVNRNTSMDYSILDLILKNKIKPKNGDTSTEFKNFLEVSNPFDIDSRQDYANEISQVLRLNNNLGVEYAHLKLKELTNLNGFIDPIASKTIYALHLIDGDNTIDAPGIDCEITCPIVVEIARNDETQNGVTDIYSQYPEITFFMHVLIQYWSGVKLTKDGQSVYA